ncbi:hypothetical protein C4K46_01065 [Streptococcus oricebi]|uniref:Transposase n=1 Tax=Streptococcus oricebi TaxID=1547447 RepID=A0ABS5B120_9STRE|nr:hypothetical protein [Streptococcus oricebi]
MCLHTRKSIFFLKLLARVQLHKIQSPLRKREKFRKPDEEALTSRKVSLISDVFRRVQFHKIQRALRNPYKNIRLSRNSLEFRCETYARLTRLMASHLVTTATVSQLLRNSSAASMKQGKRVFFTRILARVQL